ncbi:MAG TPA: hypothetical protein VM509_11165 [Planctomycetota bacterium]|nr:hypothetical protein [Planctomycetota bacterium]
MTEAPASKKLALSGFVFLLAAFAYRGAITDDFTGGDTLALIEVSRIRSFGDFVTLLTQPMLPIITKFYRPTANFSYAVDGWIWGLDARGFHITDVAIHSIVSVLVCLTVLRCSKHPLAALLAGATFALHPSLMETVPSSARRHDMIAGLFMLLSLLALPDFADVGRRRLRWCLSLGACALALGAKEASIVFPAVVFGWALCVGVPARGDGLPWRSALRLAAPHLVLGLCFVALRAVVLGGAGGNAQSFTWTLASIPALGSRAADFAADLFYPLRVIFHPYAGVGDRVLASVAAVLFACALPALARAWRKSGRAEPAGPARVGLGVCALLGLSILAFPAVSWWLRAGIEAAWHRTGWPLVAGWIDSPRKQPAELYVWKAFDLARMAATGALACAIVFTLVVALRSRPTRSSEAALVPRSWTTVFALWIALHLALFLAVQRYHSWYAYVSAIPFCCWLGMLVAGSRTRVVAWFAAATMLWLGAHSPLVRGLESWRSNGRFSALLMAEIARVAEAAPAGSTLEFVALPNQNFSWHRAGPEPLSPFTMNRAGTISWVKLIQPGKDLDVVVRSQRSVVGTVTAIRMETEPLAAGRILVRSEVTLAEAGPSDLPEPPRDDAEDALKDTR